MRTHENPVCGWYVDDATVRYFLGFDDGFVYPVFAKDDGVLVSTTRLLAHGVDFVEVDREQMVTAVGGANNFDCLLYADDQVAQREAEEAFNIGAFEADEIRGDGRIECADCSL